MDLHVFLRTPHQGLSTDSCKSRGAHLDGRMEVLQVLPHGLSGLAIFIDGSSVVVAGGDHSGSSAIEVGASVVHVVVHVAATRLEEASYRKGQVLHRARLQRLSPVVQPARVVLGPYLGLVRRIGSELVAVEVVAGVDDVGWSVLLQAHDPWN
ncbi:hypothetical protein Mapa_006800 [Marchantia paleacea]|nr:hypothetical protein Mapa_006800 [Marchantia paleacea]